MSEAEAFWTEFLRSLARRGLRGVKLVISDDHKGLKAAATRILGATWQDGDAACTSPATCWPMPARRQGRRVVSAFVATAFAQEDADSAKVQWRQVALSMLWGAQDRVEVMVKTLGMVNAVPNFTEHPKVIDGCTDLFNEVLGEAGTCPPVPPSVWAACREISPWKWYQSCNLRVEDVLQVFGR